MIEYDVVVGSTPEELSCKVDEACEEYWVPQGGMAVRVITSTFEMLNVEYYQAVIRHVEDI